MAKKLSLRWACVGMCGAAAQDKCIPLLISFFTAEYRPLRQPAAKALSRLGEYLTQEQVDLVAHRALKMHHTDSLVALVNVRPSLMRLHMAQIVEAFVAKSNSPCFVPTLGATFQVTPSQVLVALSGHLTEEHVDAMAQQLAVYAHNDYVNHRGVLRARYEVAREGASNRVREAVSVLCELCERSRPHIDVIISAVINYGIRNQCFKNLGHLLTQSHASNLARLILLPVQILSPTGERGVHRSVCLYGPDGQDFLQCILR